jgi:hypothetical protein
MSAPALALYLGLGGLRGDSGEEYEESRVHLRRAREMVQGRTWPYHLQRWLEPY